MLRRRGGARRRAARPLCHHGQHRAAVTRRSPGGSGEGERGSAGPRVHGEGSRHTRPRLRCVSRRLRVDPSLGASGSAATTCQPRAHHASPCLVATLACAMFSGVSTRVNSLQMQCWFGLGWTEMRVLVFNSF